ncbi:dimethylamine monooxygenase subunit DmmA family protein [Bacillus sp. ISL-75]|uniref:dimethylamine monooxygenase subunit DmmA family protein n=1 Tax=Bacillus sp. ISL-75 TaxID=2819137 RepID=UPI00255327D5|nr:dimethylamine monooxygenase subunit DmmA family protein [Bacillus sp. ISL-75]
MIQYQFSLEERLYENVYSTEVKLLDGAFPQKVGILKNTQEWNGAEFIQLRSHYVEISKDQNLYRLFYHEPTKQQMDSSTTSESFMGLESLNHTISKLASMTNKVLLFIDEATLFDSLAIIYYLNLSKIEMFLYINLNRTHLEKKWFLQKILPNRIHIVSSFTEQEISPILQVQVMGTKLYIAGQWSMMNKVKEMAYQEGFTDEEILFNGIGPKDEWVFCVKCYQINRKVDVGHDFVCEHCSATLDVSVHYSKRLDAYLGYLKI